jgi:glucokinase
MQRHLAVGADIGGTNIRVALVDKSGRVRSHWRERIGEQRTPGQVAQLLARGALEVCRRAGVRINQTAGVAAGLAAQLYGTKGWVAVAPNLGWREVDFGTAASAALGRRVQILNDLDAIALGESAFGAARAKREVLVVFAGTGIGAGLVLGGRLQRGAGSLAGEIGHVKVRPGGRLCGCGQRGCLEAYLGGANLSARLRRRARRDWPELLRASGALDEINPGTVEKLFRRGDPRAAALWRELAGMLGLVLANAITLLNPRALVVGGTVLRGCPALWHLSRQVLEEQVLAASRRDLEIVPARLGDMAGVKGAAAFLLGQDLC